MQNDNPFIDDPNQNSANSYPQPYPNLNTNPSSQYGYQENPYYNPPQLAPIIQLNKTLDMSRVQPLIWAGINKLMLLSMRIIIIVIMFNENPRANQNAAKVVTDA